MKKLLLSLALTLAVAANVSATTTGISSLTVNGYNGGFGVSGYIFSISTPIQVTGLGFYDNFVNSDTPTVNLYDASGPSSGTLLASLTTTPGMGTNTGAITYGTLATPVTLSAGSYEVVSSLYYKSIFDTVSLNPALTLVNYVDAGTNSSSGFSDTFYTTTAAAQGATANADIQFQAAAVPEPSTWAMLFCGFLALLFVKRFNRKNSF